MADKTATFAVKVPVETNADEAASSVEEFQRQLSKSQDAVKQYSAVLRTLKGNSDEVKATKEKLRASINAEQNAISRNTVALLKSGKSAADVGKAIQKQKQATDGMKNAVHQAGGPVSALTSKLDSLGKMLGSGNASMTLLAGGIALGVAAFAAFAAGVVAASVALTRFVLEAGNELRTMGLLREAIVGSAADAGRMGDQIELLATKVPTSRAELNRMYTDLRRNLDQTRISGQGIVDVFNATAQTSSAMGDSAGRALESILTRGKQLGTFRLSFGPGGIDELQGLGIASEDVAKQLAKNLKIGVDDARQALFTGRVKLDDGAKAVREVVEKRFGKVNLSLMQDLKVQVQKFKDALQALVRDINLQPFLEGFQRLAKLFSVNTVTGQALKGLLEDFFAVVTKIFVASLPFVEKFFTQLVIEALKLELALIELGAWVKQTFGIDFTKYAADSESAITLVKGAFYVLTPIIKLTALAVIGFVEATKALITGVEVMYTAVTGFFEDVGSIEWDKLGVSIIDGIIAGLKSGVGLLDSAVENLGERVKGKFKALLQIGSPSKVFEGFGEMSAEGYARGLSGGVSTPTGMNVNIPGGQIGGGGTNTVNVTMSLAFPNAKDGEGVRRELTSPSFRAEFTKMIEDIQMGIGIPTQKPQAEVL